MMNWIAENIGKIVICAVLIAAVAAIIMSLYRDRKRGKSSCCGSCAHCAMCSSCHAACESQRKVP